VNGMTALADSVQDCEDFTPYHNNLKEIVKANDDFVVWDGEGANAPYRKGKRHNYILFGCFNGTEHASITGERLRLSQCLEFIIEQELKNPGANHVSFYFDYDVNMILNALPVERLQRLRTSPNSFIEVTAGGQRYGIQHIPHKWLQITKYLPGYHRGNRHNRRNRSGGGTTITVRIQDMAGFFQCSLLKALDEYLTDHPYYKENIDTVIQGKESRHEFTFSDIEGITSYWERENVLFHALASKLRDMLYSVGLHIKEWHGPGALANYVYEREGILSHKSDCGEDVYRASRFGYAGGRFELFRPGRHRNVYGIDKRSAYPAGIEKLPSLANGEWRWRNIEDEHPIAEFGIYHIRLSGPQVTVIPSPLFHRDKNNIISFSWNTDGWYWTPEIQQTIETIGVHGEELGAHLEFFGGWEWVPHTPNYPFGFVRNMFNQRKGLKEIGDGSQKALKLALNSLYGKMAQRAGWKLRGGPPKWHQLEWAGWVTSYTRAQLYSVIRKIPFSELIAVETDGIYTTMNPKDLNIPIGDELGEWEVTEYDELIYLQSGVYTMRQGDKWTSKYRGLDHDSISTKAIIDHSKLLVANQEWPPLIGTTTRFVGYTAALHREEQNRGPTKAHHCKWETAPKEISIGLAGKRRHVPSLCEACELGMNAYEMPHDLAIQSRSIYDIRSQMHDIPWIDQKDNKDAEISGESFKGIEWREDEDEERGLLRVS